MTIWTALVGSVWLVSLAVVISSILDINQELDFYENSEDEFFLDDYMEARKQLRKWEIALIGLMVVFFM